LKGFKKEKRAKENMISTINPGEPMAENSKTRRYATTSQASVQ